MKKRLSAISPVQLGFVFAAFYAAISLISIPFMLFFMVVVPHMQTPNSATLPTVMGFGAGMIIALPIIYGIIGFIIGVISAAIYNLIAMLTGGVEFTFTDVPA